MSCDTFNFKKVMQIKGSLSHQHCIPCEGGTEPLNRQEEENYLSAVSGWEILRESKPHQLLKNIQLKNFTQVIELINHIAKIAEAEGHHPNLYLHDYKHLRIELYTHAIGGLSTNDFILAAKIDELLVD